jgi:flagellar biogenesis protein FliO
LPEARTAVTSRTRIIALLTLALAAPLACGDDVAAEPAPAAPPLTPASSVDLNPRPLGGAPAPRARPSGPSAESSRAGMSEPASPTSAASLLRTAGSLALVLGLIVGCAWGVSKLRAKGLLIGGSIAAGARAPSGVLEMLGRYPLGRGQTLLLVKLDQRVLLLGQTVGTLRAGGGSLATLCELSDPEDVASVLLKAQDTADAASAARFQTMLRAFDERHAARDGADAPYPEPRPTAVPGPRTTRATPAGDRAELWDHRADPMTIPLIPVPTDRRPAAARASAHAPAPSSDAYGSLRDRLASLRGEAHR